PVVDARPGPGQLRLVRVLAVVLHQCKVDMTIGHVTRDVLAVARGLDFLESKYFAVKLRSLLEIVDFEGNMHDARHGELQGMRRRAATPRKQLNSLLARHGGPSART